MTEKERNPETLNCHSGSLTEREISTDTEAVNSNQDSLTDTVSVNDYGSHRLTVRIFLNRFFIEFLIVFFHPLILQRVFSLEKLNHVILSLIFISTSYWRTVNDNICSYWITFFVFKLFASIMYCYFSC